jgi:ubiquitin carboxyl-terminal hydrolase 7
VKNDLIVLFLKYFDVENQALRGVGHVYLSKEKKVEDLNPSIMKKMGWGDKVPDNEKIILWEEIKPTMIEALKPKQTLKAAELQDGDIICFQLERKAPSFLDRKSTSTSTSTSDLAAKPSPKKWDFHADAKGYYEFLYNRRFIRLMPHPTRCNAEEYPAFDAVLSIRTTYDQLCERVGFHLGVEPTHLRLYTVNNNPSSSPRSVIKRSAAQNLHTIMNPQSYTTVNSSLRSDSLYFEVLEMSLAEMETKKVIRIILLSDGITKDETFDIFVSKNSNTEDLIEALVHKAKIPSEAEGGKIRLYETSSSKFSRILPRDYSVLSINEYSQLIAERIPAEELETEDAQTIQVYHFHNDIGKIHGIPFRFMLKPGETFMDTKKRLEIRTGYKGKSFEKIKFALVRRVPYPKAQALNDDDILWDMTNLDDDFLGLDHVDRSRGLRNGIEDLFLH